MDFTESHIEQALSIAKDNYEKERKSVPIGFLPYDHMAESPI